MDDKQQNFYKRLLINIRVKCLKQGIKKSKFCQRIGKSAIFVLNRVRVRGAAPHLPTQGYIEYLPRDVARLLIRCPKWKLLSESKKVFIRNIISCNFIENQSQQLRLSLSFTKEPFTIFIYFVTGPHSSHTNQR